MYRFVIYIYKKSNIKFSYFLFIVFYKKTIRKIFTSQKNKNRVEVNIIDNKYKEWYSYEKLVICQLSDM